MEGRLEVDVALIFKSGDLEFVEDRYFFSVRVLGMSFGRDFCLSLSLWC